MTKIIIPSILLIVLAFCIGWFAGLRTGKDEGARQMARHVFCRAFKTDGLETLIDEEMTANRPVSYIDSDGVFYDTQEEAIKANEIKKNKESSWKDTCEAYCIKCRETITGIEAIREHQRRASCKDWRLEATDIDTIDVGDTNDYGVITITPYPLDFDIRPHWMKVSELETIREKAAIATGFYICKETGLDEKICDCSKCSINRAMQPSTPSEKDYPDFKSAPPERFYR